MFRSTVSGVSALSGFVANDRQAVHPGSSSPSKIPYGGFSPVRLQTGGSQPQPSPPTSTVAYRRSAVLPASPRSAPEGSNRRTVSASLRCCPDTPVQRPLARRRVVLSRRVVAYYGLIRGSGVLPTPYVLRRRVFVASAATPARLTRAAAVAERQRFPNLSCVSVASVPFPIPRRIGRRATVLTPSVGAFALFPGARHPRFPTLIGSCGGSIEAAEFALCCGPEAWLALHRQGRLPSSFHPMSRLTGTSNMTTRSTVNCRARTFTGKTHSRMGCEGK